MSLVKVRSGLTALFQRLGDYFETIGLPVKLDFGVDAYFQINNQGPGGANRIVIIPGHFDGKQPLSDRDMGYLGTKLGHSSLNPKEVGHWSRPVTFAVWAAPDLEDPKNALLQNENTEALLEALVAGVHTVLAADFVFGNLVRTAPPQQTAFGEQFLVFGTVKGPLFYPATDQAFPTAVVSRGTVS